MLRIFGFLMFIFIPAIAVLLFAAFVLKSSWWFQVLGLPALVFNGLFVCLKPIRRMIGQKVMSIAATASPAR
jgi:hypothetical protein